MRTALRITLLGALVATLFSPAQATAAPAGCATNYFEVYEVSMKTDREVYRLGERALVTMTVTEASTGAPVADAYSVAGALVDGYYANKAGTTNDNGVAKLKLDLKSLKPGWAELRGLARTYYNQGDAACAGIGLYGYRSIKDAFLIRR
jgi:hypothetical protein